MNFSDELQYNFSRSGGKGGQNVNKVETKVQLRFHVSNSMILTQEQKDVICHRLANRISEAGELLLSCQTTRSQLKNKEIVTKQLYTLITNALIPRKKRKKSKMPESLKRKRLKDKRLQSLKKENRKRFNSSQ